MSRLATFLLFLSAFCALSVAATVQGSVVGTMQQGIQPRSSVTLAPSYSEVAVDSTYRLGPGDFLDIGLESNYLTVQIYPDGSVAIEECGSVMVAGKTLSEARELILDLVSKRYKREYCYVQLSALKRFRASIMGAVVHVGQHPVDPQTRLSYFIRQAGGPLPTANLEDIILIRKGDTTHIDFNAISTKGDFANDPMLEQGDQVFVPYQVMGENVALLFPGYRSSVPYKEGRTIQEYFELSGAGRIHNYGYKAVCVREPDSEPRWIPITEMSKVTVKPNTELEFTVKEMLVYIGGAVARIGQVEYNPSWHAIDYIAASGLNTISGSWSQVKVWRGQNPDALTVNVTQDPILPGDYIEIPKSRYESFKDFTLFLASLLTVVSSAFIIYVNYK
ncbi:MAG: polysaccharide export protein [Fibrobacter sp.]|nr:polysaccharide export protein [Fibrobacter sp.]